MKDSPSAPQKPRRAQQNKFSGDEENGKSDSTNKLNQNIDNAKEYSKENLYNIIV